MSLSLIAFDTGSGSGPELPMQVVQPKPTRLKPSASRSSCRPAFSRYSATTWLPGASEVLTQGLVRRPFATALRARSPAPIMTLGFEVLVHDVIAAMTTSPWPRSKFAPSTGKRFPTSPPLRNSVSIALVKPAFVSASVTRSWGRFGPASEGCTSSRFSSSVSVNTGSGVSSVRNIPCALA